MFKESIRYLCRATFVAAVACLAFAAPPAFASTKESYSHYLRALLLQRQGDAAGALKEYELAAEKDPQSSYILEQAVQLAVESGQPEIALQWAQRLVANDPRGHKARFTLGNVYWARGELNQAQKTFEEALKLKPDFSDAMLALGNLLSAQSPEKAKEYFLDYLKSNPEHAAEIHYQVAMVEHRQGHINDAITHLQSAVELDPGFQHARYTLAQMYEASRDTDAALGQYLSILEGEPENLTLLNHIGELYFLKDDAKSAQAYFLKTKSLSSDNPGACFWLAVLAEQEGDFSLAAEHLMQSSAIKEYPDLNLRLSYYLSQADRLKEAVYVLEGAHQRWPDNADIAYFLAMGYDDLKQTEKAIALLRRVLERDTQSRDVRFQLGALYEKLGRMEDCERELRALLATRPNDAVALNYLGYSLADRGLKLQEAQDMIRRAVDIDPSNGAYRDSLGWVYFKQKRYEDALPELQRAIELLRGDATVWDHLGDIYQAQGNAEMAWKSWKRAVAHDAAYAASNTAIVFKIASLEKSWKPDVLGDRLLQYFQETQGPIDHLAAFCNVSGTLWNKPLQFSGLLFFKEGNLNLELLGPLFVPMFRVSLSSAEVFSMDDLPLEGPPRDALSRAIEETFIAIRDYLDGRIFRERPAAYHRGWRTHWIATQTRELFLSGDRRQLNGFRSSQKGAVRLFLEDFQWEEGRLMAHVIRLESKEFSLSFQLSNPNVRFANPSESPRP